MLLRTHHTKPDVFAQKKSDVLGIAVKGMILTSFLALGASAVYGIANLEANGGQFKLPPVIAQSEILPEHYGELTEGIVSLPALSRIEMQNKYNEKMEDGKITVEEYQSLATDIHNKQAERFSNLIEETKKKFKM